jgi:hypothetical protein
VVTKTKPNAYGFYHYPISMHPQMAAKKLISCMIKRHQKEIDNITKSKDALNILAKTLI